MSNYTPPLFRTPFHILSLTKVFNNGVNTQTYVESNATYYCSARSFGGTEKTVNNVLAIEDTITIETYFIPSLKAHDRIKLLDDNSIYELLNSPEDINREHKYMKFKAVRYYG